MIRLSKKKEMMNNITFTVELDSMDRMLMQIELTVIAGDHESYKISDRNKVVINLLLLDMCIYKQ